MVSAFELKQITSVRHPKNLISQMGPTKKCGIIILNYASFLSSLFEMCQNLNCPAQCVSHHVPEGAGVDLQTRSGLWSNWTLTALLLPPTLTSVHGAVMATKSSFLPVTHGKLHYIGRKDTWERVHFLK